MRPLSLRNWVRAVLAVVLIPALAALEWLLRYIPDDSTTHPGEQ
jgi:hypothetical protein